MTEDFVFGTPVFTTMGGKSKCPGETGTSRRESGIDIQIIHRCKDSKSLANGVYIYNKDCYNLPYGEIALFSVIITNLSPTSKL
jgi:hypothetical protein